MSDLRSRFPARPWVTTLLASAIAMSVPAYAAEPLNNTTAAEQTYTLDIPAQDLADALNQLATATGIQVTANAESLRGLTNKPIKGRYTGEEALTQLLSNTTLEASASGTNSYTIRKAATANAVQLDDVSVHGSYLPREQLSSATGLGLKPQETPQSVTIFTEQRIKDQKLDTVAQAVSSISGVTIQEVDDVRNTFNSRGFEVSNYQVDGVPLSWTLAGDSGETIADVSIYERIEVVRGATGLLTGAGDPSASINLVRKHADSTELNGELSLTAGNWKQRSVMADVGSKLNESGSVRGRVVAKYSEEESFQDLYEDDRSVFYGTIEADLTANTLLRAGISYDENNPTGVSWGALPTWYTDGSKTDWDVSKSTSADWTYWKTKGTNYFASVDHTFNNGWLISANLNRLVYEQESKLIYLSGVVDKATGNLLASASSSDLATGWPINSYGVSTQNSIDLHLTGDFIAFNQVHEFTLGALYSEQDAYTKEYEEQEYPVVGDLTQWDGSVAEPAWADDTTTNVDMTTEQKGFYAATRLSLTNKLKVILGTRVSSWNREGENYGEVDFGDNNIWVPYVGALYDLNEDHRLYASHTGIFNPQSERKVNGDTIDPTKGTTDELGLKSSFLNDRLQTSVAVFYTQQKNLALATSDTVIGRPTEQAYTASDETTSKGFEFELVGEITDGWQMSFGATRFKAEDDDGNEINTEYANKLINLYTTYNTGKFTVGGGIDWQGRTHAENLEQGSYGLVSLMGRYSISPKMSAQLNLNNLTDEKYYSQIGFFSQYRYGAPRNGTLSLNYKF